MTRVTFGTAPSTFLLAATIKHHLKVIETEFPDTVNKLQKAIYVDDVLLGASTIDEATSLYKEAKEVFKRAAMNLRKWTSNNEEMNKIVNEHENDEVHKMVRSKGSSRLLGMIWQHSEDMLCFPLEKWT